MAVYPAADCGGHRDGNRGRSACSAFAGALVKAAGKARTNCCGSKFSVACLLLIFLVMTALRIWFDLAEADVVLSDQKAVRKSIGAGFRHIWRGLGLLLAAML